MGKKLFPRFSIFFVVAIFGLTSFFSLTGCGISGGGGKEELKMAEVSQAEPAPQPETSKPLPAAEASAAGGFETDEFDDEIQMLNGSLNWSKGFVRAKGFGLPPDNITNPQQAKLLAFRAAYADALVSLLEITKGVHVTANTTVEDYIIKNNTVELKVNGIVKGAKVIRREYRDKDRTGVVEVGVALENVAMSIPKEILSSEGASDLELWDGMENATLRQMAAGNDDLMNSIINSVTLDEIQGKLGRVAEENEQSADRDEKLLAGIEKLTLEIEKLKTKEVEQPRYTGIVVNAAGSGIKPVMAPTIYYKDEDEYKVLYGIDDGRARDANVHALVMWERTLSGAGENPRVTQTPLVVNATHLGKEQSALAISAEDAKTLESMNEETHFLEEGKVVIVR